MTIAAAFEHNEVGVITDDEAALKYLAQKTGLQATTSLTLLREHLSEAPAEACLDVILNLRIRARYVPGPRHPEVTWWQSYTQHERYP